MKTDIILIRHGKTIGNTFGKYIGTTDEGLCDMGRQELLDFQRKGIYPEQQEIFQIYESPMLRCSQTRELLYPLLSLEETSDERAAGKMVYQVSDLRECDFGEFENKNYKELQGNEQYQRWIDSNGTLPFPGGESREMFIERISMAFLWCMEDTERKWSVYQNKYKNLYKNIHKNKDRNRPKVVFVVHGGTIMALMHRFGGKDYYDCQIKNGHVLQLVYHRGILTTDTN